MIKMGLLLMSNRDNFAVSKHLTRPFLLFELPHWWKAPICRIFFLCRTNSDSHPAIINPRLLISASAKLFFSHFHFCTISSFHCQIKYLLRIAANGYVMSY